MYLLKNLKLDLSDIPKRQQHALLKLIARVSEASYRRGLQHGCVFEHEGAFTVDPGVWRYARTLDDAPLGECNKKFMTSLERIDCEYGGSFFEVGLMVERNE